MGRSASKEMREYFSFLFKQRLDQWKSEGKKGEKRTQADFARLVSDIYKERNDGRECGITKDNISKYVLGKAYPEEYMDYICEAFGEKRSYFSPSGHDEKYRLDRSFVSEIGKAKKAYADQVGLSIDFLTGIKSITDFDKLFPLYAPMTPKLSPNLLDPTVEYKRMPLAESAEMFASEKVFQVNRDGKTVILNNADIVFLVELQKKVKAFIEYQFYSRKAEMEEEQKQAAAASIHNQDSGIATRVLPLEELERIDPYLRYVTNTKENK